MAGWREHFLAGGQAALKARQPDVRDDDVMRLKDKIGDLTMENELLYEKARRLKQNLPLPSRSGSVGVVLSGGGHTHNAPHRRGAYGIGRCDGRAVAG